MSETAPSPAPAAGLPVKKIALLVAVAVVIYFLCRDKTAGPPPAPAA